MLTQSEIDKAIRNLDILERESGARGLLHYLRRMLLDVEDEYRRRMDEWFNSRKPDSMLNQTLCDLRRRQAVYRRMQIEAAIEVLEQVQYMAVQDYEV